MKITNPCRYFIDGSTEKVFTYIPGDKLFQVTFRSKGHIPFNALVHANDQQHVLQILTELVEFRIQCAEQYAKKVLSHDPDDYDNTVSRQEYYVKMAVQLKATISHPQLQCEDMQLTIVTAPKNQLYKVSWASNDNLLN